MKKLKINPGLQRFLFYGMLVGTSIFVFVFVITCTWIGLDVNKYCEVAKFKYGGDCVTALSQQVDDAGNDFTLRNHSIWSLGQIGDSRALKVLKKYYTGNIPSREPYADGISQYELKKAIKLAEGGTNVTHLFWKVTAD